jgi:transposase
VVLVPNSATIPLTVDELLRVVAERDAEVAVLKLTIDKLKLQLARRAREQYGTSSEQLGAQLTLVPAEPPQPAPAAEPPKNKQRRKAGRKPRELPAHLPRETQVHYPKGHGGDAPCACSECGGKLRQLGEDVSEQLEYVPGRFKVIRHVRPKLACMGCQGIFQAAAPSRPIQRGLPGPALLAHVFVGKYCDHTPLYRQSRIYARDGVEIDRSTMTGWVDGGHQLLDPLVAAAGRYVLAAGKVHADDTPVPVLDPGRGRTKTGRLWVYVRDDRPCGSHDPPAVWFRYSPDRQGKHPREHLKRYRGILQADAYSGYEGVYNSGRVQHAACWAQYLVGRFICHCFGIGLFGAGFELSRLHINSLGHSDCKNASRSGFGRQGLARAGSIPACFQKFCIASRFICKFVVMYRPVVATLACPR